MQNPSETHSIRKGILPRRIREFMETESSSGIVMIVFAVLAIVAANSPFSAMYKELVGASITFGFQDNMVTHALKDWVKDILMVFFFLVIGLELKREMCEGFLSKRDQIILPLLAAVGGMAVPALIFLGLTMQIPKP